MHAMKLRSAPASSNIYAGAVTKFGGQTIPVSRGGFDFTLRQPMGVVAAIVPWNFPFPHRLLESRAGPGRGKLCRLETRQPVAIDRAAAWARWRLKRACLPACCRWCQARAARSVTRWCNIRSSAKFRSLAPRRSANASWPLAAHDLKRVSLELGGKSPNIVFADADLEQAASSAPMSVFANTGQDCCARSRMFVERPVFDQFVERFVRATKQVRVAAPDLESTQVGPLVSASQRETSEKFIDEARQHRAPHCLWRRPHIAARVLSGADRAAGGGNR